ncbi:sulfolactate dehydrogenase [Thalassospira profundimaris]|uniref:Sulfolactate dehydrogenase n=1 Tax=Thalassospira profundimaris TaxID=502049 RepID=A0A367XLD1_9PROT|nr:Ldh family oxidoreductase [Thalassospira profundimaris]RCK53601.1 sulfolactate dehydrogenase [Thalassospira profundimaris]
MLLSLSDSRQLIIDALVRNNVSAENAASVATALVAAEASGQGGHGFRRVEAYATQARSGKVDGQVTPSFSRPAPGILAIDAAHGYAYPAIDLAVAELPGMARAQGIAMATIRRSHHAGVMGLTVERFAQQGLLAIMVANAPAAMAPWGGVRPIYGTNPLAFAAPVQGKGPIVVDMALSKVARGKIMAARQKGVNIPEGWALDRDGNPTTDASAAMEGTMIPTGDAKGAALALMVEILAAGLSAAHFSHEATSLFDDKGAPPALGQTIIAIDPKNTAPGFNPLERIYDLAEEIALDSAVRLPGRRGQALRDKAANEGIEVEDDLIALVKSL